MQKEVYEEVVLEIVEFETEDLIQTSPTSRCPDFDPEIGITLPYI